MKLKDEVYLTLVSLIFIWAVCMIIWVITFSIGIGMEEDCLLFISWMSAIVGTIISIAYIIS
jgi:hypothetical protein